MSSISVASPLLADAAIVPRVEPLLRNRARWAICGTVFGVLVLWIILYPYTGDGDSVLHYLNARDAAATPVSALHAWARPGVKLFMAPFATHGIFITRIAMAALATLTVWHTMRLAEELEIPSPLLAGPMLLWQSLAFAIASDTMTEMPMALGIVCAIRLWRNGWWKSSALLIGFLPAVRPEGFFLGVLWGMMVLIAPRPAQGSRGSAWTLVLLSAGLFCWAFACWRLTPGHDPLYVLTIWNWPPGSYASYGKGPLLFHVYRWPIYCGGPMVVLFILGIIPSLNRQMVLAWAVWGLIFGVHTILYWRGWFASCGMMRILACTSPITALICLYGWNALERALPARNPHKPRIAGPGASGLPGMLRSMPTATRVLVVVSTLWVFAQYALDPMHYDCFPIIRCTDFIRQQGLVGPDTIFFSGNAIATAELNFPAGLPHVMETPCDAEPIRKNLAALPIGSIGVWDNRQAPMWHGHRISDLTDNGFSILYEARMTIPSITTLLGGNRGSTFMDYVVLRKDGPFLETEPPGE